MIYPADSAIQLSEQLGSELPATGLTVGAHQQLQLDLRLWTTYCRMENTTDIIYEIINIKAQGLSVNNRELKQRRGRGRRKRERQKRNRFRLAKQQLCTRIMLFLHISLTSLNDYNVKVAKFTFCRRREHKTTFFSAFSELWYSPLEFNSKNHLPTFDEVNEIE